MDCSKDELSGNDKPILPFLITNYKLKKLTNVDGEDSEKVRFSAKTQDESDGAFILKNVVDKGKKYEADRVKPEDASAVIEKALSDSGREEVLFYVHGWRNSCRAAINTADEMNKLDIDVKKKFLVIPVVWASTFKGYGYTDDRTEFAPEAASDFRELYDSLSEVLKESTLKKSILCQSMGNVLLRVFAQANKENVRQANTENVPVFDDIFMASADVRWDLFNEDVNSEGSSKENIPTSEEIMASNNKIHQIPTQTEIGASDNLTPETLKHEGCDIINLVKNKVHILYNRRDKKLLARQMLYRREKASAIGRFAGYAIDNIHPKCKDKVVFHHCGYMVPWYGMGHNWYNDKPALEYYENPNADDTDSKGQKAWLFRPGN